jgi:hypothetical protein
MLNYDKHTLRPGESLPKAFTLCFLDEDVDTVTIDSELCSVFKDHCTANLLEVERE